MIERERVEEVARRVVEEVLSASAKFPPFNSAHEGFAVLDEERDELWEEVKRNPAKIEGGVAARRRLMEEEAIQVGAMAIRFVLDVCQKG